MADKPGTLELLLLEFSSALAKVGRSFAPDTVLGTLSGLGVKFPPELLQDKDVSDAAATCASRSTDVNADRGALLTAISGGHATEILGAGATLLIDCVALIDAFDGLVGPIKATGPGLGGVTQTQVDILTTDLRKKLFDLFMLDFVSTTPGLGAILTLLGIIERKFLPGVPGDPTSPPFMQRAVHLDRVVPLLSDPAGYLRDTYQWGSSAFDGSAMFGAIADALAELGMPSAVIPSTPSEPARLEVFAVDLTVAPPAAPTSPPGLAITFVLGISGSVDTTFTLPLPGWTARAQLSGALTNGSSGKITPPASISLTPAAGAAFTGQARVTLAGQPADPFVLVGISGGSGLTCASIEASAALTFGWDGQNAHAEPQIDAKLKGVKLGVDTSGADGFISSIAGSRGLEATSDLELEWSASSGFKFHGAGTLHISIPVNLSIGPLSISMLDLEVGFDSGNVVAKLAITASATLGPVAASIDGIGVKAELSFPQSKGALPTKLGIEFKPPTGLGIAVHEGPISGGGFISFDPDAGRYFGAVELSVYDISVKAFGLIETKVPGVNFSFVIVISAEFTAIQLGFGFTLNGVGGLVGINRSVDSNALAGLVRAGRSEELLFPKNLITNAPTIIRDLGTVFPARQSHYVFGPLGKLGWGTPTLITGEIGIILEIPGPVIVLLGEVKCLLPKPDEALVKFNLSIAGTLDFPNKSFSLDAALHDSIISGFPVSGQMAMRLLWGEQPNFVLSIGGFHPAYQPPKDFPKLQPMAMDLGKHGAASITVSGFFAVTSNTVQVGGDAHLHAGGSGITLDASVSVKALFVFSPFHFQANIDASVQISFHGYGPSVHLSGLLEGPSPWHIRGEVCVSILFWDACLGFDETFGGGEQPTVPELDPWFGVSQPPAGSDKIIGLQTALEDAGNWSGVAPDGSASVVSRAQGGEALVDPLGGLSLHQKAVPVETDQPINRFGVAKVSAPVSFKLNTASIGSGLTLQTLAPVNDFFAPAQFFQMDDGKKLSSPGFELRQAGYTFGENANNLRAGSHAAKTLNFATSIIAADGTITDVPPFQASNAHVAALNKRSAVALFGATQAGTRRFVDRLLTQAFDVRPPAFVLASATALTAITGGPAATTRSAALLALDDYRTQNPEQGLNVQVSASHELAA